jgi:hypothetical protein
MILIDKKISPDWNRIKADYISGHDSLRKLAEKYTVPFSTIRRRCEREKWADQRKATRIEIQQSVVKKTAETAADNALIASRIRTKLLLKLEKEIDALPDLIGSETRSNIIDFEYQGKNSKPTKSSEFSKAFKIRDLTAAYKDLTGDLTTTDNAGSELLQSLLELERRVDHD